MWCLRVYMFLNEPITSRIRSHIYCVPLARELAPFQVRVNAIAPGYILTDMTSPMAEMFPVLVAQTPQGRLGDPDDIAWAAVYLGSDEAKFVTGQTLSPNGGWHMSQ